MKDDTRDELLLAVGSLALAEPGTQSHAFWQRQVHALITRARHERERPEDRG